MAVSLATLCEIVIKPRSAAQPPWSIPACCKRPCSPCIELTIRTQHALRVATLPWVHRDPFDRLLVAPVMADGLTLQTADPTLKRQGA